MPLCLRLSLFKLLIDFVFDLQPRNKLELQLSNFAAFVQQSAVLAKLDIETA